MTPANVWNPQRYFLFKTHRSTVSRHYIYLFPVHNVRDLLLRFYSNLPAHVTYNICQWNSAIIYLWDRGIGSNLNFYTVVYCYKCSAILYYAFGILLHSGQGSQEIRRSTGFTYYYNAFNRWFFFYFYLFV